MLLPMNPIAPMLKRLDPFRGPFSDPLTEVLRSGARRLIEAAVTAESFARYAAVRDAALVEWAGSIRAIPLKKTVRPRITWLPA